MGMGRFFFPAIAIIFLSACIKAYIPFVNEPSHSAIINEGRALYPQMFRQASETEKIGSPSICIDIAESSDMDGKKYSYAEIELRTLLTHEGFVVFKGKCNNAIRISGTILARSGTSSESGSFTVYDALASLKATDMPDGKDISSFSTSTRGFGLEENDAIMGALTNSGREAFKTFKKDIIAYYRLKSVASLEVYGLSTLRDLNDFYLKLKGIRDVKNVWLIDYRGENAYFDVSMQDGGAGNLARGLLETFGTRLKINRPSYTALEAALQKK